MSVQYSSHFYISEFKPENIWFFYSCRTFRTQVLWMFVPHAELVQNEIQAIDEEKFDILARLKERKYH